MNHAITQYGLRFLRVASGALTVVCLGLFLIVWLAPERVERAAKSFAQDRMQTTAMEKLDRADDTPLSRSLEDLRDKYLAEADVTAAMIKARVGDVVAAMVARLCHLDCKARSRLAESLQRGLTEQLAKYKTAAETVQGALKDGYRGIITRIFDDLKIFLGSTGLATFAVFLIALLKPALARPLFVPATLLLVSSVASASIYLFGQNWFFTILFNDYMGYGYAAYIGVIFLFLVDIVYFHAAITTTILEAFAKAVTALVSCF